MKQFCHLHPTEPAQWHCHKCNFVYCSGCIDARELDGYARGRKMYMCPKCNLEAEWLGLSNVIEPFWRRLPAFFLYPFHYRPLILVLLLAFLQHLFAGAGLVAIVLRALFWGVLIKYCYESLKLTARGNLAPPGINHQTLSDDFGIVFKQYAIYVVIGVLFFFISGTLSPFAGIPFLVFASAFLPAMIMLLITTNSVIHALNPMLFVPLAVRIGWGYVAMYFFLILLLLAPAALLGFFVRSGEPSLSLELLYLAANNYYTIIFYHLMGYVILQYSGEIGYDIEIDDVNLPGVRKPGESPAGGGPPGVADRVGLLVKEGQYEEAVAAIEAHNPGGAISDPVLAERYYTLLKMTRKEKKMLAHGTTYLDLLARNNDRTRAMAVYKECMSIDQTFSPSAAAYLKIAGWLDESGKARAALATLNRLVKTWPADPLVPKAFYRSAQIFHDRLMNTDKAKKLLQALIRKYPDHAIADQARRYLASL